MYHPGKVLAVFSTKDKNVKGESNVQATLEMWDENVITFLVAPEISEIIKKGDVVLVDYRPVSEKYPFPRHIIMKVLKDSRGKEAWKCYADFMDKKKGKITEKITKPKQSKQQPIHTFAG